MKEIDDIMKDIESLLDVYRNPGARHGLMSRIKVACEALVGLEVEADRGPWKASADGRRISSDNFDHDVQLQVSGDFYDDASRRAYSSRIAEQLNNAVALPSGLPEEPPAGLLYSMGMRYRHDFGIEADDSSPMSCGLTPAEREVILRTMRQLYEEVSGHGFFQWDKVTR